ncbi:pheromone-regulated protein prm10 [Stygiomarasmius scandens]|uniref:Pheromone-regulated protein prm10 n=1 Tax=Marasmiellus scandens TaxID=2682957 RepID=A0ABR1JY02_9AGAR
MASSRRESRFSEAFDDGSSHQDPLASRSRNQTTLRRTSTIRRSSVQQDAYTNLPVPSRHSQQLNPIQPSHMRNFSEDSVPEFHRPDGDIEAARQQEPDSTRLPPGTKLSSVLNAGSIISSESLNTHRSSDATLVELPDETTKSQRHRKFSLSSGISSVPVLSALHRTRRSSVIVNNVEDIKVRQKFILTLAKALLTFGAPSHRIQSQLVAASNILGADAEFVHLPNIIIVSIRHGDSNPTQTYFVRATGRVALTSLHRVHLIYRDVLHDNIGAEAGTRALRQLIREPPIYPLYFRCTLAFFQASIICAISFGGSLLDMWISGACACVLQYLGLSAAHKSSMYAKVYEITVTIIVAFVARALSSIPGDWFCYSAISSAGVVLILPGFTVLVDRRARKRYYSHNELHNLTYTHGRFEFINGTNPFTAIHGVLGRGLPVTNEQDHIIKGCIRDPSWTWYRQPFPLWTLFILVPLYSTCSSLSNLQRFRSVQLPVMVFFSCCAYAANKGASLALPGRTDLISATGAFVIGLLGNLYSRVVGGTAFTSMVTGVLFLVPSGIAQGGGLSQNFHSAAEQYSTGFSLALRMISVASGVTVGLFASQVLVYCLGTRKNAAHFAF